MKRFLLAAVLSLAAGSAVAAPFCVVTSYGDNCYYYSAASCQEAAERARSTCVYKGEEDASRPPRQSSGAPFCLATSYGANCYYYSMDACQRAAERSNGRDACIVNPDR